MSLDDAEYGSDQDEGKCVGGGWDGHHMKAINTCYKWEKWYLLE